MGVKYFFPLHNYIRPLTGEIFSNFLVWPLAPLRESSVCSKHVESNFNSRVDFWVEDINLILIWRQFHIEIVSSHSWTDEIEGEWGDDGREEETSSGQFNFSWRFQDTNEFIKRNSKMAMQRILLTLVGIKILFLGFRRMRFLSLSWAFTRMPY